MNPRWLRRVLALEMIVLLAAVLGGVLAATRRMGDYNDNGIIETADMFDFAQAYRNREDPRWERAADLNRDGRADEFDVFFFLREWNTDREKVYRQSR